MKPFIMTAQDKYLHQDLGTNLLNKLKADHPTFTGNYLTLVDTYVRKVVCFWSLVEMLPSLRVKINNGTLATHSTDDWQSITEGELKRLVDTHTSTANYYTQRLVDYLCDNSALFPEYNNNANNNVHPIRKVYGGFSVKTSNGARATDARYDCDTIRMSGGKC
jgi:membrane-bound inhibitor of C-type lysozyme